MAPSRPSKPQHNGREDRGEAPYEGLIGQATSGMRIAPEEPQSGAPVSPDARRPLAKSLFTARYVIPAALVLFGLGYMVLDWPDGAEAFSLFAGAGLSVLLLNVLYRMGVEGDRDRDKEEAARDYFSEHGVWPDEPEKGRGPTSRRP